MRSLGTDITLDDVLTILDEHYNTVKVLDALNQELFQLCMGEKETVSDWGVCLLRHLQALTASFPECFPLDCLAKLECITTFTVDSLKGSKAMVAYMKASINEKMYSNYLQAAREAEKEEAMEPIPCSQTGLLIQPKLKVMSFFPLQKLKGTQPTKIPCCKGGAFGRRWQFQRKGQVLKSEDPDGINGMTEEFIVHLAQSSERGLNRMRNAVLPLQQPRTFYPQVPIGEGIQDQLPI